MQDATVQVRYNCYSNRIDLAGRDILSMVGRNPASGRAGNRDDALSLFPFLLEPEEMEVREIPIQDVTAFGEVADEVHDFLNAGQGFTKIKRFLLRNGEIIELQLGTFSDAEPRELEAQFTCRDKAELRRYFLRLLGLGVPAGAVVGAAIGFATDRFAMWSGIGVLFGLLVGVPGLYFWSQKYARPKCGNRP